MRLATRAYHTVFDVRKPETTVTRLSCARCLILKQQRLLAHNSCTLYLKLFERLRSCLTGEVTEMSRFRFIACCVWLLGIAVALTGLYSGLDHWGRFFPKYLGQRVQMPLDVVLDPLSHPISADATCVGRHRVGVRPNVPDDDYTGDQPDEPVGDRLTMWLCDDGTGQKQFALGVSPCDAHWLALVIDPSDRLPTDEGGPSALSLSSLHVRLQI